MDQIVIKITFTPSDGKCLVEGPLDNQILTLGLLSKAERIVQDFVPGSKSRILQPVMGLPPLKG